MRTFLYRQPDDLLHEHDQFIFLHERNHCPLQLHAHCFRLELCSAALRGSPYEELEGAVGGWSSFGIFVEAATESEELKKQTPVGKNYSTRWLVLW